MSLPTRNMLLKKADIRLGLATSQAHLVILQIRHNRKCSEALARLENWSHTDQCMHSRNVCSNADHRLIVDMQREMIMEQYAYAMTRSREGDRML
jgi:hypothetical protein